MKIEIEETELAELRAQLAAEKARISAAYADEDAATIQRWKADSLELASLRAEAAQRRPTPEEIAEQIGMDVTSSRAHGNGVGWEWSAGVTAAIARLYLLHALDVRGLRGVLDEAGSALNDCSTWIRLRGGKRGDRWLATANKATSAYQRIHSIAASPPSERLDEVVKALRDLCAGFDHVRTCIECGEMDATHCDAGNEALVFRETARNVLALLGEKVVP